MNLHTLPRLAVNGYLTAVKWPVDRVARLVGGGNGTTSGPELFVDRADAAVRDAIGRATFDSELRADAARRSAAADERERALRLRAKAQERKAEADQHLTESQQRAEQQREQAAQREQEQRRNAEQRRR